MNLANIVAAPARGREVTVAFNFVRTYQGRGVHVTGVSAAYTFKLNKNILSE
jgi:hypothetical protein